MRQIIFIVFLLCVFNPWAALADPQDQKNPGADADFTPNWEMNSSVTYTTGDFGTDTTTNTIYVPLTITRYFDFGDLSGTIPYIYQKSGPGVTAIGGRPFQTRGQTAGETRTAEGLGDMILKGSYFLLKEQQHPFDLSAIGEIKFPTADDNKGLGTGEFDETIGLEAGKSLDEHWRLFTDVYYTFIGEPAGTNLDNEFAFDVGGSYQVSHPTRVSISYSEKTALIDGRPNPRDLILGLQHKFDQALKAFGDITIGLSDGSPNFGITAGIGSKF